MPSTYYELHYHFVWATKERLPLITHRVEVELYGHIRGKCTDLRVRVHALDGIEDHSHLVCSLPTTISIADFLQRVKGASSHFANELTGEHGTFARGELDRLVDCASTGIARLFDAQRKVLGW